VKRKRRPARHPHDEIEFYEAILLEQTELRPGSWVSEELRQIAIRLLAEKARAAPPKQGQPPKRSAERHRRLLQERRQKLEREPYYGQLRARYFVAVVSGSAAKKSTMKTLTEEAAKKFGIGSKAVEFEAGGTASLYNAVNRKWLDWVKSISVPQERTLPARVPRSTAAPEFRSIRSITIHRSQWSVDHVTERAAKVAVRIVKRATAGVEWPFADFNEDTVQRYFKNHFAKTIKAAGKPKPGR